MERDPTREAVRAAWAPLFEAPPVGPADRPLLRMGAVFCPHPNVSPWRLYLDEGFHDVWLSNPDVPGEDGRPKEWLSAKQDPPVLWALFRDKLLVGAPLAADGTAGFHKLVFHPACRTLSVQPSSDPAVRERIAVNRAKDRAVAMLALPIARALRDRGAFAERLPPDRLDLIADDPLGMAVGASLIVLARCDSPDPGGPPCSPPSSSSPS